MKNFGIGCGLFVLIAIIVAVAVPREIGVNIAAYAMLFSIPVSIVAFCSSQFDRFKWAVWAGVWVLTQD